MDNKLYIPEKIRVGFQEREGTYTGKLAYIIYYDEKNKIRKETSFDSWRNEKLGVLELDNKPRSGYLFNKGVQRYAYHFGSGRSMLRVYDPRDFEFEIDIDNLEAILMNSDVSKKEIMGDFVFAWSGKDLILLPVNSQEYKDSVQYTEKQYRKVSTKDLIKGATYSQKKNDDEYIYVGHLDWNIETGYGLSKRIINKGKKHIFYKRAVENEVSYYARSEFFSDIGVSTFSECLSEEPVHDFPEIVQKFENSYHSQKSLGFVLGDIKKFFKTSEYSKSDSGYLMKKISDNQYVTASFKKADNYEIKSKDIYGRIDFSIDFHLYLLSGNSFEELYLDGHHYSYNNQNSKSIRFKNEMIKEIFQEKESLSLNEIKAALKREGYKRPCLKRSDGELFFIESDVE